MKILFTLCIQELTAIWEKMPPLMKPQNNREASKQLIAMPCEWAKFINGYVRSGDETRRKHQGMHTQGK